MAGIAAASDSYSSGKRDLEIFRVGRDDVLRGMHLTYCRDRRRRQEEGHMMAWWSDIGAGGARRWTGDEDPRVGLSNGQSAY